MIRRKNRTRSSASSSNVSLNGVSGNQSVNFLNQLFREEWLVQDCVGFRVMLMDSVHINISAVKNGAEIGMRFPATNHQIHAIKRLHDEVGDEQIRLGFGGLERLERVERRREQSGVEAFHREQGAD